MPSKKILTVLSEYGYWGEELLGPLECLEVAGHSLEFVTPRGGRPRALPVSMDPGFVDPPLGMPVTSAATAAKVRALDDSPRLDHPRNLAAWFPERPYFSAPNFLRALEEYNETLKKARQDLDDFAALLLVGGSGPIVDMVNNQRLHDVVLAFYQTNRPICAICYGVACLAFARDLNERQSILHGRHVTGHTVEYDYHDGTGFLGSDLNMGPPPYTLEYILRDTVGPEGQYHGNFGKKTSVIVDYPFITARSNQCSYEAGDALVAVLDRGLRRQGW
ncbi:type 1 glutamine amidotransferase domain-containing protein [Pararhodospirillum photometricum]|uniref:ThiJ/PfpI domain protein n=1 Tax=Pararhodospirillum photometricum DSM 122 TaxID=1150469 RepID=H6SLY4_PARPM|nr:type 1 glutamine amidotransferase domain-containing protein [Pararhodospirillum photometricum]CCG08999.1 ThiJ/PfpI domain protein [Pararhodospirillum photometricum DSM 122]